MSIMKIKMVRCESGIGDFNCYYKDKEHFTKILVLMLMMKILIVMVTVLVSQWWQ